MSDVTIDNPKPVKASNDNQGSESGGGGSVSAGGGGGSGSAKMIEESDIVKGEQPKKSTLFFILLESWSFSNPVRMLDNKNVIVFLVKLLNVTVKTKERNQNFKNVLDFMYCIPPFWKTDYSLIGEKKLAVGSLGLILDYVNMLISGAEVKIIVSPEINVLNLFGLHYLLLKLFVFLENYHVANDNDSESLIYKEICRDLLNLVFRSTAAVQTGLIVVLKEQIDKNFVLELFVPRKMFQIYKKWKSGAYSAKEAIEYYEFTFDNIINPIFKIPTDPIN